MYVITDDIEQVQQYIKNIQRFRFINVVELDKTIQQLTKDLFGMYNYYIAEYPSESIWNYLLINKFSERSQYDILIDNLNRRYTLPDGIICLTGESLNLRGFRKNRSWIGLPGNIHLSAFLSPGQPIEKFDAGFMLLSAVSVVQAIDKFEELKGKAWIKWINDILIEDTKICGVLAYTQVQGKNVVGSVIGIGLNVESRPLLEPTKFVPKAGCLNDFLSSMTRISMKDIFPDIINSLEENYKTLLNGGYYSLLNYYRNRSIILNKDVRLWSDTITGDEKILCEGKVIAIGDNLELFIEGRDEPIINGRLELLQ